MKYVLRQQTELLMHTFAQRVMACLGVKTFGILLPLTTRGADVLASAVGDAVESGSLQVRMAKQRVSGFFKRLVEETQLWGGSAAARVKLYIGVDEGDYFSTVSGINFLHSKLEESGIVVEVLQPFPSSYTGKLCRIWRELAARAFTEGRDFTVLLGDDVTIHTYDWMDRVERAYGDLAADVFTTGLARDKCYGFGCVCFADASCPNFPSFPVLHRTHFQIFPEAFENQDADPFLFEVYKRFNAARILNELKLVNGIGGHDEARYEKKHIEWKDELVDEAVAKVRSYLSPWQHVMSPRSPSLDIVVPSYRCDLDILRRICELPVANEGTYVIIIVDRPGETERVRAELEKWPRVRVRGNRDNLGASAARNHGIQESAAEWILLLDDDVQPEKDLVLEYSKALLKLRDDCDTVDGLLGMVNFPPMTTLHAMAIGLSDVSFMFGIAEVLRTPRWGVTANLLLRRKPDIRFRTCFPKSGGGEDVDICLRYGKSERTSPFRSCPTAIVTHPWWSGYTHFLKWAEGDGQLLSLFPQHTYRSFPNVAESVVLAAGLTLLTSLRTTAMTPLAVITIPLRMMTSSAAVVVSEMLCDVIKHCAVDSTRAVDEIRGLTRILAAADSSLVILALEMGRIRGNLSRGELLTNFMRRFDWHCGEVPGSVTHERVVAGLKLVMAISVVMLLNSSFTRVQSLLCPIAV